MRTSVVDAAGIRNPLILRNLYFYEHHDDTPHPHIGQRVYLLFIVLYFDSTETHVEKYIHMSNFKGKII